MAGKRVRVAGVSSVRVELCVGEDESLRLVVADDGVGLPADLQITSLKSLGLKLVRILAQQLRAEIQVDSDDSGTRFTIQRD